jgi:hypothetical protein
MSEEEIDIINDILKILGKTDRIENQKDTSEKISSLNNIFEHLNKLKDTGINLEKTETEQCTICLESLKDNIKYLWCFCKFHEKCIDKWLKKKVRCPNCNSTKKKLDKNLKNILN